MLVIIPFFRGDKPQTVRLAEWISELGGVSKHDCLLAVHKDTDSGGVIEPLRKAFGRVAEFSITDDMIVEREQHAYAANVMWKRTANHVADMNEPQPWLWLEPDAVPMTAGWLDDIAAAYQAFGKPFMHDLVETARGRSNSGCGVYPAKVRDYTDRLWELSNVSWDILLTPDFAPNTAYTTLIQDIGFTPGTQQLPTFTDAASLSIIRAGAVLFHRCKDGTLIDRLREQKGGGEPCAQKNSPNQTSSLPLQSSTSPILTEASVNGVSPTQRLSASDAAPAFEPQVAATATIADRIRSHTAALRELAEDKPGRKAQILDALRKDGLIKGPKKRGPKKTGVL